MRTNHFLFAAFVAAFLSGASFSTAQNSTENSSKKSFVLYSVFVNVLPDDFDFPGIGFVNVARGKHSTAYVGFVNYADSLRGAQISFINTARQLRGAQIGFINTTGQLNGAQISFINTAGRLNDGAQIGFINTAGRLNSGAQIGFINSCSGDKIAQIGFVNTHVGNLSGTQIGFINTNTGKLKGFQLGFVNYADSISGVPLGFISIVRKGGYRALEAGVSEIAPVNLSFKLGVEKLYTSFNVACNFDTEQKIFFGLGIGSIIPLKKSFFFNPEITVMNTANFDRSHTQQTFTSFVPAFGYSYKRLNFIAGISASHLYTKDGEMSNVPFFQIVEHKFDAQNKIFLGARAGVRIVL
ncbi:MAG: hypothetical protein LBS16_04160 [Prevotellaceae bacterium]|jgi:hypothetical protein|nr:hypothetical protein [Prevotellaceae bacterium]